MRRMTITHELVNNYLNKMIHFGLLIKANHHCQAKIITH